MHVITEFFDHLAVSTEKDCTRPLAFFLICIIICTQFVFGSR